jgi:hypothetical protein
VYFSNCFVITTPFEGQISEKNSIAADHQNNNYHDISLFHKESPRLKRSVQTMLPILQPS